MSVYNHQHISCQLLSAASRKCNELNGPEGRPLRVICVSFGKASNTLSFVSDGFGRPHFVSLACHLPPPLGRPGDSRFLTQSKALAPGNPIVSLAPGVPIVSCQCRIYIYIY